jgi:hypothetical protein
MAKVAKQRMARMSPAARKKLGRNLTKIRLAKKK